MAIAILKSRALIGMHAPSIKVEVHLANGLPSFTLVGLPEAEVRESRERVRAALQTSGFEFPARRITVNLAPADLPKESGRYDLPIALGLLVASGQLPDTLLADYEFAGELSLNGELRPIRGALAMAHALSREQRVVNCKNFMLPTACMAEAAFVSGVQVFGAPDLLSACAHLKGQCLLSAYSRIESEVSVEQTYDLAHLRGQMAARRALEVAAAGQHSMLLVGPPGAGKSMLAQRLPGILPLMDEAEALESAALLSLSNQGFKVEHWRRRPFRAPHHSASMSALIGGGSLPRPGEISLAHCGVLFLDELPHFSHQALEGFREPLQNGYVSIARAAHRVEFPARFQLLAAMNPCPCGYLGHSLQACTCSTSTVQRYQSRLSGPLLDRIDIHIKVPALGAEELLHAPAGESSKVVAQRVLLARNHQIERQGKVNQYLVNDEIDTYCVLDKESKNLLQEAQSRLHYSARSLHRILRVARTIADLDHRVDIEFPHVAEAIQYQRPLFSRTNFGTT